MVKIFRWTVGDINNIGENILEISIVKAKKLLKKFNFLFFICLNSDNKKIEKLCLKYQIELIRTEWLSFPLPIEIIPKEYDITAEHGVPRGRQGSFWKLCPPRVDIDSYELVCDNDLIIQKISKELEEFLTSDKVLITEENVFSFGKYSKFIDKPYNSGLYGLYPNYDFEKFLVQQWQSTGCMHPLLSRDEQGLIISTLKKQKFIEIPKEKVCFVLDNGETTYGEYETIKENGFESKIVKNIVLKYPFFDKDIVHFLGANRVKYHDCWNQYITNKML